MGPNSGNTSLSGAFKVMILVLDILLDVKVENVILPSEPRLKRARTLTAPSSAAVRLPQ